MFTNLVHLEFLRLIKSRFLKAATSIALCMSLFFLVIFNLYTSKTILSLDVPNIDISRFHQVAIGNMSFQFFNLVVLLTVTITICDYFKNRLFINIQNYIGSDVKYCAAQFASLFLFCSVIALFPWIITLGSAFLDEQNYYMQGFHSICLYSSLVLVLFLDALPAMFFAKLFKRMWPTIIVYYVFVIVGSFLVGFVTGLLFPDDTSVLNENAIFPHYALLGVASGRIGPDINGVGIGLTCFNYCLLVLFLFCVCCLVTRKRVEK